MKAKRPAKNKPANRRAKAEIIRAKKKATRNTKPKKAVLRPKKPVNNPPPAEIPADFAMPLGDEMASPFAALNDERALATAWEILGDEEYVLDEEIWNSLYNRIKLQLLRFGYAFRVMDDANVLSPYAVTPMPAFRGDQEHSDDQHALVDNGAVVLGFAAAAAQSTSVCGSNRARKTLIASASATRSLR